MICKYSSNVSGHFDLNATFYISWGSEIIRRQVILENMRRMVVSRF